MSLFVLRLTRRHVIVSLATASLSVLLLTMTGCQKSDAQAADNKAAANGAKPGAAAPPPPIVKVSLPIVKELSESREYTGHLEPVEAVEVRARIRGVLEKIHFEEGAEVEKGALLYEIDPSEYQAVVEEKASEIGRLEHQEKLAESEAQRSTELFEKTATSREAWESKQTALQVAKSELKKANASLRQAEINLGYTKIYAPISGRVGRRLVTQGNLVGHSEPTVLTTIVKMDPIYVHFEIPERDLLRFAQVSEEQKEKWSLMDAPFAIGLESEKGFPHPGVINFRDNRVESDTGTVLLRGTLPNPNRYLVPGLFARIRIPVGVPTSRILIPQTALAAEQRGRYVLVVGEGNKVEQRLITIDRNVEEKGYMAVSEGIQPTDRIIVSGLQRARPGIPVTPEMVPAPGTTAPAVKPPVTTTAK